MTINTQSAALTSLLNEQSLPPGFVLAEYREVDPRDPFFGSPFALALPEIPDRQALASLLRREPPGMRLSQDERNSLTQAQRLTHISLIPELRVPLPRLVDFTASVLRLIHKGYRLRKLTSAARLAVTARASSEKFMAMLQADVQQVLADSQLSMSLLAPAGSGKSKALQLIESLLPRCIIHVELGVFQIPMLVIEMPHLGSSSHAAASFGFQMLDKKLHNLTNYAQRFPHTAGRSGGRNGLERVQQFFTECQLHAVGMVAFDEAQRTADVRVTQTSKAASKKEMDPPLASTIITACNTSDLPLLFSGKPELLDRFDESFSATRRLCGNGSREWKMLASSGSMSNPGEFEVVMAQLFKLQFTQAATSLTPDLLYSFRHLTQGLPDAMVKLFAAAQEVAVLRNLPHITPASVAEAFEIALAPMAKGIETLRADSPIAGQSHDLHWPEAPVGVDEMVRQAKKVPSATASSSGAAASEGGTGAGNPGAVPAPAKLSPMAPRRSPRKSDAPATPAPWTKTALNPAQIAAIKRMQASPDGIRMLNAMGYGVPNSTSGSPASGAATAANQHTPEPPQAPAA